ncbi:uncharacterized protein BDZ83DRAFT_430922 [Colletotrichum acutatum]|uniref:Uncharacterized protein n=1 Tax=Glomerella acutata TaxID=27357 RepID=A0AAD8UDU0_GLOAC|nr:uncharacterized protein BDZ83DRAFT_430922 [Colletotrichum acutatum]KAK1722327.1 hypothetical protein BDZ83DRAFT_430922 [Colletotrichum acutatum]
MRSCRDESIHSRAPYLYVSSPSICLTIPNVQSIISWHSFAWCPHSYCRHEPTLTLVLCGVVPFVPYCIRILRQYLAGSKWERMLPCLHDVPILHSNTWRITA